MLLLAIETSSARGSMALHDVEAASLLAEAPFPEGLVHGREITVHLQEMMSRRGLAASRLAGIAVGLGPGSYTGIRVGVTAAKTLAFALGIPVIPESSLRVMAANLGQLGNVKLDSKTDVQVVPAIDGKRRQIYLARYRVRRSGEREEDVSLEVAREVEERVLDLSTSGTTDGPRWMEELRGILTPGAVVVGDAAEIVIEAARGAGQDGMVRGPRDCDWPRAAVLGDLACRTAAGHLPRFDEEMIHGLVPIYLRPSEAERKFGIVL